MKIKSSSTSGIKENVLKTRLERNKKKIISELGQNVLWSKTFRLELRGDALKIKKNKMS